MEAQRDFVAVVTGIALGMGSPSGTLGKPLGLVRAWVVCVCGLCAGEGRPGWPPRGRCKHAVRGGGTAHLRARNLGGVVKEQVSSCKFNNFKSTFMTSEFVLIHLIMKDKMLL